MRRRQRRCVLDGFVSSPSPAPLPLPLSRWLNSLLAMFLLLLLCHIGRQKAPSDRLTDWLTDGWICQVDSLAPLGQGGGGGLGCCLDPGGGRGCCRGVSVAFIEREINWNLFCCRVAVTAFQAVRAQLAQLIRVRPVGSSAGGRGVVVWVRSSS